MGIGSSRSRGDDAFDPAPPQEIIRGREALFPTYSNVDAYSDEPVRIVPLREFKGRFRLDSLKVAIDADSLEVQPLAGDKFTLKFRYTATAKTTLVISYKLDFISLEKGVPKFTKPAFATPPIPLEIGKQLVFTQPPHTVLHAKSPTLHECTFVKKGPGVPILLQFKCADADFTLHVMSGLLTRSGNAFDAIVVKQRIQVGDIGYLVQGVYGIAALGTKDKNTTLQATDNDSLESNDGEPSFKCVICLTEPRDTIVIPCRHLCMCHDCANLLVSKPSPQCPICRALLTLALKIN